MPLIESVTFWWLARKFSLERIPRGIVGPRLRVSIIREIIEHTDSDGEVSQVGTDRIDYQVDFETAPRSLTLRAERHRRAIEARQAERVILTGDAGFDDLVWIISDNAESAQAYLTKARRDQLVEGFRRLPRSILRQGRLTGRLDLSVGNLFTTVATCVRLARVCDEARPEE